MAKKKDSDEAGHEFRYAVSLGQPGRPGAYKDFFETNSLADAKRKCEDAAADEGRPCIVYDRQLWEPPIAYRSDPIPDEDEKTEVKDDYERPEPKPKPKPQRRG